MRGLEDHDLTFRVAELRYEYGMSLNEIGSEIGVGKSTVNYHLKRHGLYTRLGSDEELP